MSNITTATHFLFETDFMEENIRCIPMIVRFKLDTCGIKLKLKEWSKMTVEERENLVTLPCRTPEQTDMYKDTSRKSYSPARETKRPRYRLSKTGLVHTG